MSRALPALAVALLLVVAGCIGGLQAHDEEYSESEIVSLVTDMNASDADALSTTHRQSLANTSGYRGVYETRENGLVAYTRDVVVDRTDRRFVEDWRDADRGEGEVYVNAAGEYRRYRTYGDASFQYTVRTGETERFVNGSRFGSTLPLPADPVLRRYDFEHVRSDDGRYYFRADGLVDPDSVPVSQFYWDMADVTSASARLVVHEDGYVSRFSATVTFDRGGRTETVSRSMAVWAVGDAHAVEPHWVDDARNQTR